MILTGKIEKIFPIDKGTSKSGKEWRKGSLLVDVTTNPNWPKKVLITLFGKALDNISVSEGLVYDFDVDVTSREWKNPNTGKTSWFTECMAYRADLNSQQSMSQPQTPYEQANVMYENTQSPQQSIFGDSNVSDADDLPF